MVSRAMILGPIHQSVNGTMVLWTGNVNGDDRVKYTGSGNDRDPILISIGSIAPNNTISGYVFEDVNLDGLVKYTGSGNDRDRVLQTNGSIVPSNVRVEQMP